MVRRLTLSADNGSISINVLGYENLAATDSSDANWLRCEVELHLPGVTSRFFASFATLDFVDFADGLRRMLAEGGECRFVTDEEQLAFSIGLQQTGQVNVSGKARIEAGARVEVSFAFASDLSCLSSTLHEAEQIVQDFPEIGTAPAAGI